MTYPDVPAGLDIENSLTAQEVPRASQHRSDWLKRWVDLCIAIPALIVCGPVIVALCVWIYAKDRKSPVFGQKRYGKYGRVFSCYKLRTMVPNAAARLAELLRSDAEAAYEWAMDYKLRNDPRITPLGRFLRKTSLDELPQLINVIRGDMSIVGPRPIVQDEIEKYGVWFAYYTQTRPGITGLWQVSGRNDVSYENRVALDARYVREWSIWGDFAIMLRTLPLIVSRNGAY